MKKSLLIGLAAAAALIGAAALGWYFLVRTPDRGTGPLYSVERADLVETAAASGTIKPHVQVDVKSRASGQVIELMVQEGANVHMGDVLMRLDPIDAQRTLSEAQASEQQMRAQLAQAQVNLSLGESDARDTQAQREVQERGTQMGLVSTQDRRTAIHNDDVAQRTLALRRAQIAAARAQVEAASLLTGDAARRLRETEIHAPIDGTVLSLAAQIGTIVSSGITSVSGGTTVLTLADLGDLRVIGQIDEAQIGRVSVEQAAIIRVDAYPERTFEGHVIRVSPLGVRTTNIVTFDVEIVVTDAHAQLLRSGMSADVEIITSRREHVLVVPLSAVQSRGPLRLVHMASGQERRIRAGVTDGMRLEVLSGLREGERIQLAPRIQSQAIDRGSSPLPLGGPPHRSSGSGGPSR